MKTKKVKVIDLTKITDDMWLEKIQKGERPTSSLDLIITYLILRIPYNKMKRKK